LCRSGSHSSRLPRNVGSFKGVTLRHGVVGMGSPGTRMSSLATPANRQLLGTRSQGGEAWGGRERAPEQRQS
jgi:hypothetical protein